MSQWREGRDGKFHGREKHEALCVLGDWKETPLKRRDLVLRKKVEESFLPPQVGGDSG